MKSIFIITIFCFFLQILQAQTIQYSDLNKQDNTNIFFEILGKSNNNLLIYKNISREHFIAKYDDNMRLIETLPLDFLPPKTFNVDFIKFPKQLVGIYQYQKNNIVYCMGFSIRTDSFTISTPTILDTSNIGYFDDNKIYTTCNSEDKNQILIYKRHFKNDIFTIVAKRYNAQLAIQDSFRLALPHQNKKEAFGDLFTDNQGRVVFTKESRKHADDDINKLTFYIKYPHSDSILQFDIPLGNHFIKSPVVKADNLNNRFVLAGFCLSDEKGKVDKMYSATFMSDSTMMILPQFHDLPPAVITNFNKAHQSDDQLDNLTPQSLILKKNGGFILIAEDYYTETNYGNDRWGRNNYNDFSWLSSTDYYIYQPFRSYQNYRYANKRYYYNDIIILSVDSAMQFSWNAVIPKTQYDVENDNYLSYANLNTGGSLHFLFIEKDRQKDIVSNHGLNADGTIKRYPTLRSNEKNVEFMPKLGKQVASNTMIMPFTYLNKLGFAKIDF